MKKIILLITLVVQSALVTSCADEPDYFKGYDEFMLEVSPYVGTRVMHVSDIHCRFRQFGGLLEVAEACAELVVNTGDDTNGLPGCSFGDIAPDFERYRAVADACSLTVLGVQGNHDSFCTSRQYRQAMFGRIPGVVCGNATGAYGYYDYQDLRFVLLDPRDPPGGFAELQSTGLGSDPAGEGVLVDDIPGWWTAVFSQRQIDWLIATLDDARQRGLGVVTVMHYAFGDNEKFDHDNLRADIDYCQDPFMIPEIIDAMQTGRELNVTYKTKGIGDEKIEVRVPASDQKLEHIVHLFGHLHSKEAYKCAKSDGSRDYNILMLCEASLSIKSGLLDTIPRKNEDDIAASLLIIDRPSRLLHRISYGAFTDPRTTTFAY